MKKKFLSIFLAIGAFLGLLTFSFCANADDVRTLVLSLRHVVGDDYVIRVSPQKLNDHLEALGFAHLNQMPSNARYSSNVITPLFGGPSDDLINYRGERVYYRSQFMLPSFYYICLEAGVTADDYANGARQWSETDTDRSAVELTRTGLDKIIPILSEKYHIILNITQDPPYIAGLNLAQHRPTAINSQNQSI